MTWVRIADGAPVQVSAHKVTFNGKAQVQVTLNGNAAYLSLEDAESFSDYLAGVVAAEKEEVGV